jgi:hypothetical protein
MSRCCEGVGRQRLNRHNSFLSTSGHSSNKHGKRHARVAGFSRRSRRVIGTYKSAFQQKDLGSGESFDDVHRAMAEWALPGGRLV